MLCVVGKTSGTRFLLVPSAVIGRGAEGIVYRFGDFAVKKFTEDLDALLIEKIDTLIRFARPVPGFAWPTENVNYEANGQAAGFVMPLATGRSLEALMDARLTKTISTEQKIAVAISIAGAVAAAHSAPGMRICLGDVLKAANIIIDGGEAKLVDAASVSLFGFRALDGRLIDAVSTLVTPGYVPNEVLAYPQAKPSHSGDRFALAVVLFELIFGRSPTEPRSCAAAVGLDPDDAVRQGLFVRYVSHPELFPPTYDPIVLPPEVDDLFRAALLGPAFHRPSGLDWIARLSAWRTAITPIPIVIPVKVNTWWPKVVRLGRRLDRIAIGVLATTSTVLLLREAVVSGPTIAEHARSMLFPPPLVAAPKTPTPSKPVGPELFREMYR